jgi:hypothetical protein
MTATTDLRWPETDHLHLIVGRLHLTLELPADLPSPASDPAELSFLFDLGRLHLHLDFSADS